MSHWEPSRLTDQVCHYGNKTRIVLWFDVKHPDWPEEDFARLRELMERYFVTMEWYGKEQGKGKQDRQILAGQDRWTA